MTHSAPHLMAPQHTERSARSPPFAPSLPCKCALSDSGPAPLSLLHKDVAQMEIIEW